VYAPPTATSTIRAVKIKREFDPDNFFRVNQNIAPCNLNRIASSLRFSPIFSEHAVFSWRCGLCYGTRLLFHVKRAQEAARGCDDLRALTLAAAILHDQYGFMQAL